MCGTPLELWRGDTWDPGPVAVRLTGIWRVVVIFDDHVAHPKHRLWLAERFGNDLLSLCRWQFSALSGCYT